MLTTEGRQFLFVQKPIQKLFSYVDVNSKSRIWSDNKTLRTLIVYGRLTNTLSLSFLVSNVNSIIPNLNSSALHGLWHFHTQVKIPTKRLKLIIAQKLYRHKLSFLTPRKDVITDVLQHQSTLNL